ncbi:AI-2E family transporter [Occallatibacter riparius]|uniref:AI-2E family transporter n=1 Tax=Occallatibacter riparius TaxID=1002689 RepID=A0A9J7BX90_9BACT|nr:AI-2E family transporter [Occallatibacter riparius]UWZ85725.1 AI-2E family transporter [Occallatibacter riparius]
MKMNRTTQISFGLIALFLILMAALHLGTFLLTFLFGYLVLRLCAYNRSKAVSVAAYAVAVVVILGGLIYFASLAYRTLPKIADTAIPAMVGFAEKNGIDLPFTDYASLKSTALAEAQEGIAIVGRYAGLASIQSVLALAGLVVALGVFLNPLWAVEQAPQPTNAYEAVTRELSERFRTLYDCFARVMGAQIVISAINTALSALFLAVTGYPYAVLLVCLVFLCGLLPVVGNLLSNTVIVGVGFTMSPRMGVTALVFLVVIHKLEYFLNSKIVGHRIKSPMWLTLVGLVVGERLMGISGMILAPVVLYYIKVEASRYPIPKAADEHAEGLEAAEAEARSIE